MFYQLWAIHLYNPFPLPPVLQCLSSMALTISHAHEHLAMFYSRQNESVDTLFELLPTVRISLPWYSWGPLLSGLWSVSSLLLEGVNVLAPSVNQAWLFLLWSIWSSGTPQEARCVSWREVGSSKSICHNVWAHAIYLCLWDLFKPDISVSLRLEDGVLLICPLCSLVLMVDWPGCVVT